MKVIIGLAVVAVLAGLATTWVRHRGEDFLHHSFDTALPSELEAHPWAPLRHGRPLRSDRVVFRAGAVTVPRCRSVLGSYTARINHTFSFSASSSTGRAGCGGRQLQGALARATHVSVDTHGHTQRLVFSDAADHTVAQLQAKAR